MGISGSLDMLLVQVSVATIVLLLCSGGTYVRPKRLEVEQQGRIAVFAVAQDTDRGLNRRRDRDRD